MDPSTEPSDAEVLRASIEDPERFRLVFDRHVDAIYAFLAARVGHDHAEDISSEVFSIAFERRRRFDDAATSARPWLYGIAANKLRHHQDAERRWMRNGAAMLRERWLEVEVETDDRLDAAARAGALVSALAELSPSERDVLALHALGELDTDEIASVLGIRAGAVRMRLSRGRARLRQHLDANLSTSEVTR